MKKQYILLAFFFISYSVAYCQIDRVKINRKEFKKQEYGYKEAWFNVKDEDHYFNLGLGSFRLARESYLKAYGYNADNAELSYMIGKCYLYSDNKFESIKYIQKEAVCRE